MASSENTGKDQPSENLNSNDLSRNYDASFVVDDAYRANLPDMQNASARFITGANVPILKVGMSNFKLPLKYKTAGNETLDLETSITGTVSLKKDQKGINMSRIMRCFYDYAQNEFSLELLEEILLTYKKILQTEHAQIRLDFNYPIKQNSLRSDLSGWQYYKVAYEGLIDEQDVFRKRIHFEFVYSSACPCSSDLSEHARQERKVYAIPHSQRSTARISIEVAPEQKLSIEEVHALALEALKTETQVMVKREDEQAFAELNGAYTKFVEDAARVLYEQLDKNPQIVDFQVACAHLESLHSHDAVAVIHKGVAGGFTGHIDDFTSLIK
jgi:GTP cyclohydrolase I